MKKRYILFLTFLFLIIINIDFPNLIKNWEIKYAVHLLAKEGTVYVPTYEDRIYYREYVDNKSQPTQNKHLIDLLKPIYKLIDTPIDEIDNLLFSSYPNLRVYGYVLYVKKTEDVYLDYLLKSFENKDKVIYINYDYKIYTECHVSDILLLIALKGIDYPPFLMEGVNILYELTPEQRHLLKKEYGKKDIISSDMDELIRHYFEYDFSHLYLM